MALNRPAARPAGVTTPPRRRMPTPLFATLVGFVVAVQLAAVVAAVQAVRPDPVPPRAVPPASYTGLPQRCGAARAASLERLRTTVPEDGSDAWGSGSGSSLGYADLRCEWRLDSDYRLFVTVTRFEDAGSAAAQERARQSYEGGAEPTGGTLSEPDVGLAATLEVEAGTFGVLAGLETYGADRSLLVTYSASADYTGLGTVPVEVVRAELVVIAEEFLALA